MLFKHHRRAIEAIQTVAIHDRIDLIAMKRHRAGQHGRQISGRFTGMAGLHEKRWQIAPGGFFAGVYIWASEQARADFLESFRANPSRVTQLVGHDPDVIQEWELVGLAQGAEGPPAV